MVVSSNRSSFTSTYDIFRVVKRSAPALLPILRSQRQGEILALLYLHPEEEYSLTEISRILEVSPPTVHHEVSRLVDTDFLADRYVGRSRLIRANTASPLARPLTDLLTLTYGPVPVLEDELVKVAGIGRALIYGSWAARHNGEHGPIPNDVDVLVAGTADLDDLDDAAERAGRILMRPVSIRRVSTQALAASEDPFLVEVRSRPTVELQLDERSAA